MKFHMLMFMNAWMMLVLMKCKCQMPCLTLGCYISPLENMFEFEEDLFSDFGNTLNYYAIRKSSAPSAPNQHLPDPTKEKVLKTL